MIEEKPADVLNSYLLHIFRKKHRTQLRKNPVVRLKNGDYLITSGYNSITVDPNTGGRIISLKNGDFEFLTSKEIQQDNYGSTFWPSPQSYWNWPPPSNLDKVPYTAEEKDCAVIMKSSIDSGTGFQFIKEFSAGKNGYINLTYSIFNTTDKAIKAAPWEITRVKKGGLLFFPAGENPMRRKQFDMADYKVSDGIIWYKDEMIKPETHRLNIADGLEGWMAYAADNKLFIKKFDDTKPELQAPGEAEILFYISPEADYIEIEVQGKYELIEPNKHTRWQMQWTAVEIPPGMKTEAGSKGLAEYVRGIVS